MDTSAFAKPQYDKFRALPLLWIATLRAVALARNDGLLKIHEKYLNKSRNQKLLK